MRNSLIYSLFILLSVIGCKSEPTEVKVKSITNESMTLSDGTSIKYPANETVIFFVRHGETEAGDGKNPMLSEAGIARAAKIDSLFANVDLAGVLSSAYLRTSQTAEPIAKSKGVSILSYEMGNAQRIYDYVFKYNAGKKFLLVGHSNSIPRMVQELSGTTIPEIGNDEFDNLVLLTSPIQSKGTVTATKY